MFPAVYFKFGSDEVRLLSLSQAEAIGLSAGVPLGCA